jgi:hypothetical protein
VGMIGLEPRKKVHPVFARAELGGLANAFWFILMRRSPKHRRLAPKGLKQTSPGHRPRRYPRICIKMDNIGIVDNNLMV